MKAERFFCVLCVFCDAHNIVCHALLDQESIGIDYLMFYRVETSATKP
jgi:hypothetical protein